MAMNGAWVPVARLAPPPLTEISRMQDALSPQDHMQEPCNNYSFELTVTLTYMDLRIGIG